MDTEGNNGNWWKNLMNQIKMFKSKGWVTNIEIKTIRRKIEEEKDLIDQKYGLRRKKVYIGNGRTETESNCKSH